MAKRADLEMLSSLPMDFGVIRCVQFISQHDVPLLSGTARILLDLPNSFEFADDCGDDVNWSDDCDEISVDLFEIRDSLRRLRPVLAPFDVLGVLRNRLLLDQAPRNHCTYCKQHSRSWNQLADLHA